ncbi:MAG: hypothetical protein KAX44_02665, partial [Candidatus Brocadiae bacterium]|nr:hypothetical protein [Candidatus Brocadiia bacterium]
HSFRMMLPGGAVWGSRFGAQADVRFVTEKESYDLGTHQLPCPDVAKRSLVVGVSAPNEGASPGDLEIARSLSLQRFDPESLSAIARVFSALPSVVPAQELPSYALGYCSYDVLLLAGDGFSLLRQRQLRALRRWVEAGGSVCFVPGGGLRAYHVLCLNEMTGEAEGPFGLTGEGRLQPGSGVPEGGVGMFRCGLGRVVVAAALPESLDSSEWRRAAAFLWKIRSNQLSEVVGRGKWRTDLQRTASSRPRYGARLYDESSEGALRFHVCPIDSASSLYDSLKPETVRVVPFWAIVLVLFLFVLAVGPVDYCLLGALKCRRFTWILFPVLCVGFAAFTVGLSESYMGSADHRGACVFVDVGKGGRVLRWSRYELLFIGEEKEVLTELKDSLFAPLDEAGLMGRATGRASPPTYWGRFPAFYSVSRWVGQWTPTFGRAFSLEPFESSVGLDWDAVEPSDFQSYGSRRQVARKILAGRPFEGDIYLVRGVRIETLHTGTRGAMGGGRRDWHHERGLMDDFLLETSARPQLGLFSVVSQISPNGADNFEDLSVLDPTDSAQWLLLAVTGAGDDYVVYRRLYCEGL